MFSFFPFFLHLSLTWMLRDFGRLRHYYATNIFFFLALGACSIHLFNARQCKEHQNLYTYPKGIRVFTHYHVLLELLLQYLFCICLFVAWVVRFECMALVALSWIDDVVAIWSNCFDTVACTEWKLKKVASCLTYSSA